MEVLLQLSLGKFVKEFAKHLSVIEYEEGVLTLGLPKGKLNLLDSEYASKIELAIQEYTFDPEIDVHVCVIDDDGEAIIDDAPPVDEPEVETPMPAIIKQNIGGEEVNAVNARDLHKKLQSKQDFSTWIKARIQKYEFVENTDFVRFHKKMEANNATKTEYIISIRMAQELSMVEDNEIGKAARLYFIECEKIAKGETSNKKIDLLSPEFIATMRKVRTVQLATGMTKVQSSKFAREVIKREFGADMVHEVIGDYLQQLDLV